MLLQEIGNLREKRKDVFSILFALFSGLCIVVYAVISGEKPIYTVFLALLASLIVLAVAVYYRRIDKKIDEKIEALESEE